MKLSESILNSIYKSGLRFDWQDQRKAAILLIPFIFSLIVFPGFLFDFKLQFSYSFLSWLFIYFFLFLILDHMSIGVQEILEDYIHNQAIKSSALFLFEIIALISFNFLIFLIFFY